MGDQGFSRREMGLLAAAVVTASLTGLDSRPHGLGAELLTIAIVLSGVALFGYFAAQPFDSIAHSVLGGAWREKKRRKMIDQLRHHIIVCGYGRVGRQPTKDTVLEIADVIVGVGAPDEIRKLELMFEPRAADA